MNIYQIERRTRRAKNIARRSINQIRKLEMSDSPEAGNKIINLQVRVSRAQGFLNQVQEWNTKRLAQKPFRQSIPQKKQRALGILPPVETVDGWRAAGIRYAIRLNGAENPTYIACETLARLKQEVSLLYNDIKAGKDVKIFKVGWATLRWRKLEEVRDTKAAVGRGFGDTLKKGAGEI